MSLSRSPTSRNFGKFPFHKFSNGMLTILSSSNTSKNTSTSYKNANSIHSSRSSSSLQSNEGRTGKPGETRKPGKPGETRKSGKPGKPGKPGETRKNNRGSVYRATASNIKKHKRLMNNQTRVFRTKSGRTLTGLSRRSISSPR